MDGWTEWKKVVVSVEPPVCLLDLQLFIVLEKVEKTQELHQPIMGGTFASI